MRRRLIKILHVSILASSLAFLVCKSSVKNCPVNFVDRNTVLALDKNGERLMLVVQIEEDKGGN